jgi:hypothetical protein
VRSGVRWRAMRLLGSGGSTTAFEAAVIRWWDRQRCGPWGWCDCSLRRYVLGKEWRRHSLGHPGGWLRRPTKVGSVLLASRPARLQLT